MSVLIEILLKLPQVIAFINAQKRKHPTPPLKNTDFRYVFKPLPPGIKVICLPTGDSIFVSFTELGTASNGLAAASVDDQEFDLGVLDTIELDNDEPIFTIPPYRVEQVLVTASEIVDWGLEMFSIPSFWKQTKGEGIKVAVLDTGIALSHPDLVDSVEDAKDFTGSRAGVSDVQGHGTHVAGIIAARQNSGGVVGVAPLAKLLVGKVLGDNGTGSAEQVAEGIRWAIAQGADIISMSLGSEISNDLIHEAIKDAVQANIFVVCAAGNRGPNLDVVDYPGAFEETIAVGSIDRRRQISHFSSRGKQVDIVAPGDDILSTYPPTGVAKLSGTSMATPFATGVVALILAKHRKFGGSTPVTNQAELLEHLRKTAIDVGPDGFDPFYGFGLINPEALLGTQPDIALNLPTEDSFTPTGVASSITELTKVKEFMDMFPGSEPTDFRFVFKPFPPGFKVIHLPTGKSIFVSLIN